MLAFQFHGALNTAPFSVEAPYLRLVGKSMFLGGDTNEFARHEMGTWKVADQAFIAIRIESPARVCFENKAEEAQFNVGPLDRIYLIDGSMRTGEHLRDVIAYFSDYREVWDLQGNHRTMPNAVIRPAPGQCDEPLP